MTEITQDQIVEAKLLNKAANQFLHLLQNLESVKGKKLVSVVINLNNEGQYSIATLIDNEEEKETVDTTETPIS